MKQPLSTKDLLLSTLENVEVFGTPQQKSDAKKYRQLIDKPMLSAPKRRKAR